MKTLLAILVIACVNLASANNSNPRAYPIEPPLKRLYPYTSSDKSLLEELQGEPLQSFSQPASFDDKYIPTTFQPNFLDFADVQTGRPQPRVNLPAKERAFRNLAIVTNTQRECYQAVPANVTDLTHLMGDWFITAQHSDRLRDKSPETCEDIVYQQTSPHEFKKDANIYYQRKWITIKGTGRALSPGVIIIYWKSLKAPERDVHLVYSILGTDYKTFVVGYYCNAKNKKAQIVIQTNTRRPNAKTIQAAHNVIKKHPNIDFQDVINNNCAIDF